MQDTTTFAYINLFAVLGGLQDLCRLDPQARDLIAGTNTSITFRTRRGPTGTLVLENGTCRMEKERNDGQIRLFLRSPDQLNAMMEGKATPLPLRGFTRLKVLTGPFDSLTKRLEAVMRPDPSALDDPAFRAMHTEMILHVAGAALVEVANHDPEMQAWAGSMPEGVIGLTIAGGPALSLRRQNGTLTFLRAPAEQPRALMEFRDFDIAYRVLSGQTDSFSAIAAERLSLTGFIPMLDSLDKLLTRAGAYLA